jgi:hypothetical protein
MLIVVALIAGFVFIGMRADEFDPSTRQRVVALVVTVILLNLVLRIVATGSE